jgi:hypothetical protein
MSSCFGMSISTWRKITVPGRTSMHKNTTYIESHVSYVMLCTLIAMQVRFCPSNVKTFTCDHKCVACLRQMVHLYLFHAAQLYLEILHFRCYVRASTVLYHGS